MPQRANSTSFKPGQSGNPKGRPPKKRALTNLLEKAGNTKIKFGEDEVSAKKLMVSRIWEGLTTGVITFPNNVIALDGTTYNSLVKMVLSQVDGPPKSEMDVTSGGQTIKADNSIDAMKDLFQMMGQREKYGRSPEDAS